MSTGIINGKHHTNNIYKVKLIFLIITFIIVSGYSSALRNEKGWVIVIDAGHGGKDPGALGSTSREKDINLAIALKTGEYIEQNIKNVTVIYTRKNDTFIELRDRANIANKNNADLFISIHANWAKSKNVLGAETYIMGHAKDQANLEVAMIENSVLLLEDDFNTKYEGFDPKSSESYIMFSLTQKVFQDQSTDLASKIQTQFRERVNRNDRDVKQAGFWVLYNTKMPSVLVETGFITNPTEEKFLISKEGQDYLASSIFRACRDDINEIDSKSYIPAVKIKNPVNIPDSSTTEISPSGEIVFMVQIATSSSRIEVKSEFFKELNDVIEINALDWFKYATGYFTDYPAAVKYRKKLEAVYPDAFVIAVKDYKILPLQQALEQKRKNNK